jgi:hypothetical protein
LERLRALEARINDDNEPDLHSILGDKTPRPFEWEYDYRHCTPFVAAWKMGEHYFKLAMIIRTWL